VQRGWNRDVRHTFRFFVVLAQLDNLVDVFAAECLLNNNHIALVTLIDTATR
jgi:hypothetical protein